MCPVCRARFRGASRCSRCGADLTIVMTLAAAAWKLRNASRRALAEGEFGEAHRLCGEAQELCATPSGKSLELVAACLGG